MYHHIPDWLVVALVVAAVAGVVAAIASVSVAVLALRESRLWRSLAVEQIRVEVVGRLDEYPDRASLRRAAEMLDGLAKHR